MMLYTFTPAPLSPTKPPLPFSFPRSPSQMPPPTHQPSPTSSVEHKNQPSLQCRESRGRTLSKSMEEQTERGAKRNISSVDEEVVPKKIALENFIGTNPTAEYRFHEELLKRKHPTALGSSSTSGTQCQHIHLPL